MALSLCSLIALELGIAIWLVNIINGLFSFIQEYRASQATAALNKLLPSYARVLRDGKEDKILAQDLVPGDLVFIEEGDRISADGRLVAVTDLRVNQSALTGESNPIYKSDQADLTPDKTELEYDNYGICRDYCLFWFWTFYSICYRDEN